jgi:capsular exopolysaccharide synthesis family protein
LGLVVAGAVPKVPKRGINASSPEEVVQFVESFRTLRMHVMHSVSSKRIQLAIASAAPNDGKSLVASNLALSFAEAGLRTVLIDADTRRGALHKSFSVSGKDGLTEYLAGALTAEGLARPTSHANLYLISCGRRHQHSPELLTTPRLKELVDQLSRSFDVVLLDTPPFSAGIDAYAIAAAAGRILMVVRMGQTQRRLAAVKLGIVSRLPIDVLGVVLNSVQLQGEFQYYAYSKGYSVGVDDSAIAELTTSTGSR